MGVDRLGPGVPGGTSTAYEVVREGFGEAQAGPEVAVIWWHLLPCIKHPACLEDSTRGWCREGWPHSRVHALQRSACTHTLHVDCWTQDCPAGRGRMRGRWGAPLGSRSQMESTVCMMDGRAVFREWARGGCMWRVHVALPDWLSPVVRSLCAATGGGQLELPGPVPPGLSCALRAVTLGSPELLRRTQPAGVLCGRAAGLRLTCLPGLS